MMGFRLMMYGGGFVSVVVYLFNMSQVKQLSSAAGEIGTMASPPRSDTDKIRRR